MSDTTMKRWAEAQLTVGQILKDEARRDAIHFAVAPAIASHQMAPGARVGLLPDGSASQGIEPIGIVDPFLTKTVGSGERFWLFLLPNTITTLRHVWEHPAFGNEGESHRVLDKATSEAWLRNFIKHADCPDYDTVIAAATGRRVESIDGYGDAYSIEDWGDGPSLFFRGRDAHSDIPPEFWDHLEVVTGYKAPPSERAVGFSCSC